MRRRNVLPALAGACTIVALVSCSRPPVVGPISGPDTTVSAPTRVAGALEWPVRGALVSAYRPPARPTHAGVDLAAPPGTTVIAAEAGEVVFSGQIRGYEGVIAVTHAGELTTVYAHLGDLRVAEGTKVARGEPIGTIGASGYLHYEIRRAKQPIDPADLYAIGPSLADVAPESGDARVLAEEPAADVPLGTPRTPAPRSAKAELVTPKPPPSAADAPLPPPVPEATPGTLGESRAVPPEAPLEQTPPPAPADPGPGALGREPAPAASASREGDGDVEGNTTIFLSFSLSARYIAIIVFAVEPLEQ